MTPRELIRRTAERFLAAGIPDPENDSALLLSHLTGQSALSLRLDSDTVLDDTLVASYSEFVTMRLKRVPLQYILGEAPFYGRLFKVDPRVLIPRPETALLCEWALEILQSISAPRVLDLCCGSGCIGLTVMAERPDAQVTLSDLSEDALSISAVNAVRFSLDADIRHSDLFESLTGSSFDLVISNPPYIPSCECSRLQPEVLHEPRLALDGGSDGCDLYRRIISGVHSVLVPGGRLLMEIGINEAGSLVPLLSENGFVSIDLRKDYAGIDRMILATLP